MARWGTSESRVKDCVELTAKYLACRFESSPLHPRVKASQEVPIDESQRAKDRAAFHREFDTGGAGGLMQGCFQHDNRVRAHVKTAHQALSFFCARGEDDLQSAALALHRGPVFELHTVSYTHLRAHE